MQERSIVHLDADAFFAARGLLMRLLNGATF
jgi:hypothetical protein